MNSFNSSVDYLRISRNSLIFSLQLFLFLIWNGRSWFVFWKATISLTFKQGLFFPAQPKWHFYFWNDALQSYLSFIFHLFFFCFHVDFSLYEPIALLFLHPSFFSWSFWKSSIHPFLRLKRNWEKQKKKIISKRFLQSCSMLIQARKSFRVCLRFCFHSWLLPHCMFSGPTPF